MTQEDLRSLLREMRDDPVPADSLARVRIGVAEATATRRVPWWKWFAAIAAAAAVVFIVLVSRPTAITQPPAPMTAKVAPPPAPPTVIQHASAPTPIRKRRPKRPTPKPEAQNNVIVRIETADPDVVIVLVGD